MSHPDFLVELILYYLDQETILPIRLVSQQWRKIIRRHVTWRDVCISNREADVNDLMMIVREYATENTKKISWNCGEYISLGGDRDVVNAFIWCLDNQWDFDRCGSVNNGFSGASLTELYLGFEIDNPMFAFILEKCPLLESAYFSFSNNEETECKFAHENLSKLSLRILAYQTNFMTFFHQILKIKTMREFILRNHLSVLYEIDEDFEEVIQEDFLILEKDFKSNLIRFEYYNTCVEGCMTDWTIKFLNDNPQLEFLVIKAKNYWGDWPSCGYSYEPCDSVVDFEYSENLKELRMDFDQLDESLMISITKNFPNLTSLGFNPSPGYFQLTESTLSHLSKLPYLKTLEIPILGEYVWKYVQILNNLESLTVECDYGNSDKMMPPEKTSCHVKHLVLKCFEDELISSFQEWQSYLPSLKTVRYDTTTIKEEDETFLW